MKIREGFVSNSSSSSFYIAYKNNGDNICPHCGRKDPDIYDLISEDNNCDESIGRFNILDFLHTVKDKDNMSHRIDQCIADGYELMYITVSMHDQKKIGEIYALEKGGSVIILGSDAG